jgi:hypothetical protein
MMLKILASLALIALVGPAAAQEVNPPLDMKIIILAGASNASGRGLLSEWPVDKPVNGARIWNFTNAWKWELAKEPIDSPVGQLDKVSRDPYSVMIGEGRSVSYALAAADTVAAARPGINIGIVPCPLGGTVIADWQEGGRATLYGNCLRRAKEARKRGTIVAMMYSGGNENNSLQQARNWDDLFRKFVRHFRTDIEVPALPIVLTENCDWKPDGGLARKNKVAPYYDTLQRLVKAFQMSGVVHVPCTFTITGDIHATTAQQIERGEAVGAALLTVIPE